MDRQRKIVTGLVALLVVGYLASLFGEGFDQPLGEFIGLLNGKFPGPTELTPIFAVFAIFLTFRFAFAPYLVNLFRTRDTSTTEFLLLPPIDAVVFLSTVSATMLGTEGGDIVATAYSRTDLTLGFFHTLVFLVLMAVFDVLPGVYIVSQVEDETIIKKWGGYYWLTGAMDIAVFAAAFMFYHSNPFIPLLAFGFIVSKFCFCVVCGLVAEFGTVVLDTQEGKT